MSDFKPLTTFGWVLKVEADARGWTIEDVARFSCYSLETIEAVMEGREPLHDRIAMKLGFVFGNSKEFWLNLATRIHRSEQVNG